MQKVFRFLALAAACAAFAAPAGAAGSVTVQMANGRVTVIATDAPLRQILAEWARVGDTRMVNAEKVVGAPLTLQLVDVPEKEALDILLRSAAGYFTAPRPTPVAGASLYDRVVILATSRPPATLPTPGPTPFNRGVVRQPVPPQPPPDEDVDEDEEDAEDQGPMPPPGMVNPGMAFPGASPVVPAGAAPPTPLVAPRPGMLPQPPQAVPGNPYVPAQQPPSQRSTPGPTARPGPPGATGPDQDQDQ
jgi:hypothetical protein